MWKTVKESHLLRITLKNQSYSNFENSVIYQPNLLIKKFLHYFQIE
jgi:hypothetical protein